MVCFFDVLFWEEGCDKPVRIYLKIVGRGILGKSRKIYIRGTTPFRPMGLVN